MSYVVSASYLVKSDGLLNFMMISSFLSLSSGILLISQNLVNRLLSFDSSTGMISILWHSVFKAFSWLLSF